MRGGREEKTGTGSGGNHQNWRPESSRMTVSGPFWKEKLTLEKRRRGADRKKRG